MKRLIQKGLYQLWEKDGTDVWGAWVYDGKKIVWEIHYLARCSQDFLIEGIFMDKALAMIAWEILTMEKKGL